eukprot:9176807-Pyramimonas_sp.AAC.2
MILGTLGELTVDIGETSSENLGLRGQSLMKLLAALHGIALKYMNELIDTELRLNNSADEELEQRWQSA